MPVLLRSKVVVGAFEAVLKEYRLVTGQARILGKRGATGDAGEVR
jgi:hypothetical protein